MLSFQNLHVVRVSKFWSLKNLFPASIDRNLLQLEELDLSNCGVREIVAEEGGETSATGFIFPRVTYLKLWELPKLRTLYQGIHTSECPMLMKLMVYHCDHVKICQLDIGAQESLFLVEKVILNLKILTMSIKDMSMILQGQFPEDLFHKLKILHMMNDKSAVFPLGLLQRFHNLQNLVLSISSYKEIFSYEEVQKHAGTLSQIKDLMLCVLLDLNQMWKRNPKMDMILQNLEILNVLYCHNLINLVPFSTYFRNLTTLDVCNCDGLINLVTYSTVFMVQLIKISIQECKMMIEVVANEGDVTIDEIIFNKLKQLSPARLTNLISFCSGNWSFKFPSLEKIDVSTCPNMKIFSPGALSLPRLRPIMVGVNKE
ncbi:hypothetical protein EZV62_006980 [Acer yangbiense]|uniref:Disease resistance protein At4g27190-like leucine-rich repeats domain-containing protein n=1 Tax=Acer yangbiense TaxID=1000413 RepID=A0A5C7I901_9ROSI|nr:hypothetical protein EZV62_006980 [Acer yangbiense]